MTLLSYQLQLKRYQRELGLSDREFNALDVKHSNINLLRHLQLLNPIVSAPTGFWGEFSLINGIQSGSTTRQMDAYLAYNDVALTDSEQINGNQSYLFNIAEEDRLPLPNSTLQLKFTMQNNTQALGLGASEGFTIIDNTDNPLNEENTVSMLVNENNLNNGVCELTLLVTYVPQGWSGNITFVKQAGGGTTQYISIKKETGPFIATDYIYNSGSNVFSVSLASPSSYLYISIFGSGGWGVNNTAFLEAVGSPTFVSENNRGWLRYTIPSQFIGQNLTYNFSTYYDD